MFYLSYMVAELRRRSGRTILTALGLALAVGLVITVNGVSAGLDRAQSEVLQPLTGIGTDMTVSRPIDFSQSGQDGIPRLSGGEREQLRSENRGARLGLTDLGEPGTRFSRDTFVAASQLSFSVGSVAQIRALEGVSSAAGGLTLNAIHVEGLVPERAPEPGLGRPLPGAGPPENIDITSLSVSGVDPRYEELGALAAGQILRGRSFESGDTRAAVVNESYASRQGLDVGDTVSLGGEAFSVVGIAETPLGGQASDVYVPLGQLQELSDREGRVNTVYVRAETADHVAGVEQAIETSVEGASVTTASDLADRVSGTLVDAKNLTGTLGTALVVVGLVAAFLIASLLSLSSVTKRIRELGTLKALGWSQRLVVRQVTGESLLQGLLGGALGVVVGVLGALSVGALAPSLEATFADAAESPRGGPRLLGRFGQGAVEGGSTDVALTAPVSIWLVVAAVGLAVLGGLVAGAVGGLRAARLRPADALRHID